MTKLLPRTAAPSRPDKGTGNRETQPGKPQPPSKARRAAERAARLAPGSGWVDGRKRAPDSPTARALEALRTYPGVTTRAAAARFGVNPKSLYRAARRAGLANPYGTSPKGRKPGSHSEPTVGDVGAPFWLRMPPAARAVAQHLGAARIRHLFLTVGAALQHVDPSNPAAPLVIALPPITRPARRQEHARTLHASPSPLGLASPEHPTAPPQTLPARQARAAARAAALAPVDAMATAQGLPALTETLATLGAVVRACRRLAADGRMPANVGALRDACRLLGVPHLTPGNPSTRKGTAK